MSMSGYIPGSLVAEKGQSLGEFLFREFLKGASDEYVKRPLWEFAPHECKAVLSERARRWGTPGEDDFDPEYH